MRNSISLILCVSGSYGFSEVVLKNTLHLAGIDIQLLVYSQTTSTQLRHLFEKASDVFVDASEYDTATKGINYLMTQVTGEKVVLMPYEAISSEGWLSELILNYDLLEQVGALTLPYKADSLETKPIQVLDKNYDIQTLYSSYDSDHFGITCISKEIALLIGAFDESLPLKLSIKQYLYRIAMTGLKNYCIFSIPTTSLIEIKVSLSEQGIYYQTLKTLNDSKDPFIQLHCLTDLEEIAYHDLDNLIYTLNNGSKKFCSKYMRHFGIVCPVLNQSNLKHISKFARKYGFNFKIEPFREYNSGYEKSYLAVIF